jgi:hypothetical protein
VEKNCYNCGASIDERSPFCPSCGTAQIRVSPREPSPESPGATANIPHDQSTLPGPEGYSATVLPGAPSNIQWQRYFKVAWPLALAAGIATGFFAPGGFLLFLPVAVILSVRLYRKHHFGRISTGQGALLGAALSILSFVVVVAIFALYYSSHTAQFKDALTSAVNDAIARKPNPEAAQTLHALLDSPGGVLAVFSFFTFIVFCLNTIFACLAGALAASFGQDKPRP